MADAPGKRDSTRHRRVMQAAHVTPEARLPGR